MILLIRNRLVICLISFCLFGKTGFSDSSLIEFLPENELAGLGIILENTVTNSDDVSLRELIEEGSWGSLEVGKSQLGPDLNAYIGFRGENEISDFGSDWEARTIADISLVKPLFHWGSLSADVEIRELSHQAVQNESYLVIRNLSKWVRSQVLNLAIKYIELDQIRDSYELLKESAILDRERFASGLVAEDHMELVELQLVQKEIGLSTQEMEVEFAAIDLAKRVGMDVLELINLLPKSIPKPTYLTDEELDELELMSEDALLANEALQNLEASLQMQKLSVKVIEKRHWPKLNLTTGITQNERDVDGRIREEQLLYAGVSVNWNVFDGRETSGLKTTAMSQLQQIEIRYRDQREAVEREFKRSIMRLRRSVEYWKIDEVFLDRSRDEFERVKENHELEKVSDNELKAAKDRLLSKEIQTQRSRVAYLNAVVNLISDLGMDPYVEMYKESKDMNSSN